MQMNNIHCDAALSQHLEILKWKLDGSSLENVEKKIKKLSATFLYCISNLGVWLAAKVIGQ